MASKASDDVNDTVTVLPFLAGVVSDEIDTGDSVGRVVSMVALLPSVVALSVGPAFPPLSAYSPNFLNGIFFEAKKFLVIISLISSSVSSLN
mgnify:CR=1 FL=1